VTGIVDLARGRLLDVVEGRSGQVVVDWLDKQSPEWRAQIAIAAIDAFRGYANALGSSLPDATLGHGPLPHDRPGQPGRRPGTAPRPERHPRPSRTSRRPALSDPPLVVGAEHVTEKGWARLEAGTA
jgi:hypothetical protein